MSKGSHFCNVDLHVHTPISECFEDKSVTPEMIVAQAINANLNAIAITDHNTGDGIDVIKAAAAGSGLTVFPGVEITVNPGVHVLAIFPEDKNGANITDLLSELGLKTDDRNKNEAVVKKFAIQEVVRMIRAAGALPILAHIDSPSGVWIELRSSGQTLIELWKDNQFSAVEIVGDKLPAEIGNEPFINVPTFYWASDNPDPVNPKKHSVLGIGSRYSRFKVSEPVTWEGIRLCFHDPGSRIRPPIEEHSIHPMLESIRCEGGFLSDFELELNPNLNCIIGGRGTGKSCLLELIRYTFDRPVKTDANKSQANSLIHNTFIPGSKVTVRFRLDGSTSYRIEKTSGQATMVFREGSDEPIDVDPSEFFQLEVYGQKEVFEISKEPKFQLNLIDSYVAEALRPFGKEEADLVQRLSDNSNEILNIETEIEEKQAEANRLGAIEEEIYRMEQNDFVHRLELKRDFDSEKDLLDHTQIQFENLVGEINKLKLKKRIKLSELDPSNYVALPNKDLIERCKLMLEDLDLSVQSGLEDIIRNVEERWGALQKDHDEWKKKYDLQDQAYQELLRSFQNEEGPLDPERYLYLQREQRRLSTLVEDIKVLSTHLSELYNIRQRLLEDLRENRHRQYQARCEKANELTSALGRKVRITIWPQGNRLDYQKALSEIFRGTRVREDAIKTISLIKAAEPERRGERPVTIRGSVYFHVPEIPKYLDPIDLANAVWKEKQDIPIAESELANTFEIASVLMRANLASLVKEKVFELEVMAVPDLPIIELQVGSGVLGYKGLETLSVGQRCTALLSIVLLQSPLPLLIDQPEDDLDNHFIFDQIVETLRNTKEKRQFLIATHNANIPVSGDAELIVVMDANERRGWIQENGLGSIDSPDIKQAVEKILEGGENAFKIRKEKYGI